MSRQISRFWTWMLIASMLLTGCHPVAPFYLHEDGDLSHYLDAATDIEYPDVEPSGLEEAFLTKDPRTIRSPHYDSIWDVSLEEAVAMALQNSKVLRIIGAGSGDVRQLTQPNIVTDRLSRGAALPTIYDPAIQETGQNGVEQALAQFDAAFNFNTTWDRRDRPQNFNAPTIFAQILRQDQVTINSDITKRTATGAQWVVRNVTVYEDSTQTARAIPSDYSTALEAEIRQPLFRGRGTQVNRIPVVIARINSDISLLQFQAGVRNLVSDTEQAYWALYFAYRSLEAAKIGRDSALVTWQRINALYEKGAPGGEAHQHAQATEQYYFFRTAMEDALRVVYRQENLLRFLMGLAATDGRLIRPKDEPTMAKVNFDWCSILNEALDRQEDIRRQRWLVKRREMELIAARNQLLPQVDVVGIYRWFGIGDGFNASNNPHINFPGPGSTAIGRLLQGDYQEHQLGIQATVPLGFRRELAQVRNVQLQLAREHAVLEEIELEITHQLTQAIQDLDAHYTLARSNMNRRVAAQRQVEALEAAMDAGTVTLDLLLDAQRRQADAEVAMYQSLVDYNLAILNVHFRKGSLLDYNGVVLAEGPWPAKAYHDAHERARQRDASYYMDYGFSRPKVISRGPVQQLSGAASTDRELPAGEVVFGDEGAPSGPVIDSTTEPIPREEVPATPLQQLPLDSELPGELPDPDALPGDPIEPAGMEQQSRSPNTSVVGDVGFDLRPPQAGAVIAGDSVLDEANTLRHSVHADGRAVHPLRGNVRRTAGLVDITWKN